MERGTKEYVDVRLIEGLRKYGEREGNLDRWAQLGWNAAIDRILKLRRNTFIEAEWEEEDGRWYCSNCGEDYDKPTEYCPVCGAEMANIMDALDKIYPTPHREDKWDKADRVYYDKVRDTDDDPRWEKRE